MDSWSVAHFVKSTRVLPSEIFRPVGKAWEQLSSKDCWMDLAYSMRTECPAEYFQKCFSFLALHLVKGKISKITK